MSRMKNSILLLIAAIFCSVGNLYAEFASDLLLDPQDGTIQAVRFDPSYYYTDPDNIARFCESLVAEWSDRGINTIFFKAYDPVHGAKYRTDYTLNEQADYGRRDLLKYMLRAAHPRQIRIMAWLPAFQHALAWQKNPDWRVRKADGKEYKPDNESAFLCPANSKAREWWLGFIDEILRRYPDLDGIDIAEPVIAWNQNRCYCGSCLAAADSLMSSSSGLLQTLQASIALIHRHKRIASVTHIVSAHSDGAVLTPEQQKQLTGFDLAGLLRGEDRPDWLVMEFMWQQWENEVKQKQTFTPEWVEGAARTVLSQVNGRARIVAHLEITPFGAVVVRPGDLAAAIRAARRAGLPDIDIYDTHQLDKLQAWDAFYAAVEERTTCRVVVCFDPLGENDARQVASLLTHFRARVSLLPLAPVPDSLDQVIENSDALFCVGVDPQFDYPVEFLQTIDRYPGTLVWMNNGVEQFLNMTGNSHGMSFIEKRHDEGISVRYKQIDLVKVDPAWNAIKINDEERCHVWSWLVKGDQQWPYIVQSGQFWYIADLPTAFVIEGGRHIVFSDLLHDILREYHAQKPLALLRIEDVHPLTDPKVLRKIARLLKAESVPFSVSVVPFYLDPESNLAVSISDRPEFIDALQELVRSGGTIVLHGSTHQLRGESTADYEFWDALSNGPLFSDSREYVRQRIETALNEMERAELYPVTWETPHYAASQLDYGVINRYFSTAYERRQTLDLHGSDQLVPYLINRHMSGGRIIPENLGYVPLDQQEAAAILTAAQHQLLVRDGIASFFFHPFIDLSVLKKIVQGMKELSYQFSSPRMTQNIVQAPNYCVLTGSGTVELDCQGCRVHEFFIDENGKLQRQTISDTLVTGRITRTIDVPLGWMYVLQKQAPGYPKGRKGLGQFSLSDLSESVFGKTDPLFDSQSNPVCAAILIDTSSAEQLGRSQSNWFCALSSVGIDADSLVCQSLFEIPSHINLLIIPQSAARILTEQQRLFIMSGVQKGLNVVMEQVSQMSEMIGVYRTEKNRLINSVVDEYYPQVEIIWRPGGELQGFDTDANFIVYYSTADSAQPVVTGGEFGEGKYLHFGALLDPVTDGGYARFPYLIDLLNRHFSLKPMVHRRAIEVYFEPGDREDISIEDLIKMWRSNGVRAIYVSGWHFYADYQYDYERLIRLAHQNAMVVYLWLELPHVNDVFWTRFPEWREKNALGMDAVVGWRKLMALNIEACREAVFNELQNLLLSFDWDGINSVELNYESALRFDAPEAFTPMNQDIRQVFFKQAGFDPLALFNPRSPYFWQHNSNAAASFFRFRSEQVVDLYRHFLGFLFELQKKHQSDWDIMITSMDSEVAANTAKSLGIDIKKILELRKDFPYTLQFEDPRETWHLGPERFKKMAQIYGDLPLVLDIAVEPYRQSQVSHSPTAQLSGLELYRNTAIAANEVDRVSLFSEASIYQVDFPLLPNAFAAQAKERLDERVWEIETSYTVIVRVDGERHQDVLLDGDIWPVYDRGRVTLPIGHHRLQTVGRLKSMMNRFESSVRIVDLSGELISAHLIGRGVAIHYSSPMPNWVILNEQPRAILLDGKKFSATGTVGELGYSIKLPSGEHQAIIFTMSSGTQFLKFASLFLSGLIVLIGFFAGFSLIIIYVRHTLRKRSGQTA